MSEGEWVSLVTLWCEGQGGQGSAGRKDLPDTGEQSVMQPLALKSGRLPCVHAFFVSVLVAALNPMFYLLL